MTTDGHPPVRTIALINQKGGVGKTTTTVNLAAGIASLGRKVLVVDLDPQAHATLHMGVEPGQLDGSVYDLLLEPSFESAGLIHHVADHLDLLPSETDLAAIESELAAKSDRHDRLRRSLSRLVGGYEFVLLDCPPSLGMLTINALASAREVIIPMQAHFLALQGVGKLMETVSMVASSVNAKLRVSGVVLCMHDSNLTHAQEVVADLEEFFEQSRGTDRPWRAARVYRPPIRRNIKLAECPSFGQTVFDYAPSAAGAQDYLALARSIVGDWDRMLERRAGETPATSTHPSLPAEEPPEPPSINVVAPSSSEAMPEHERSP